MNKTDGDHLVVKIYNPTFEDHIDIDAGIAPLIQAIWNAGLITTNCCQDRSSEHIPKPGIAWIEFAYADMAETFLDTVDGGEVDIHDADQFMLTAIPEVTADEDIRLAISVRYPHALTDTLTERMQRYADRFMKGTAKQEAASAVVH